MDGGVDEADLSVDFILSLDYYNYIKQLVISHVPPDKVQETMITLWDIHKHSVELAMSFQPISSDADIELETWLPTTNYTAEEQREILVARDTIWTEKNLARKCFLKAESYPEIKWPRPIKGRDLESKAKDGAAFSKINEHLFNNIQYFIKTIPVDKRAERLYELLKEHKRLVLTDFSSFESHFIDCIMFAIEFPLYIILTRQVKRLQKWRQDLLLLLRANPCKFRDFTLSCMSRASGEFNTSSGNGWSNVVLYTYTTRVKGCIEQKGQFEGDDGITGTKPQSAEPTTRDFHKLGWSCKLEVTTKFEEASFCGLVSDIDDLITVCDVREYLANFGWTRQQYLNANQTTIKALLRSKGYSAISQYPGTPIIDALGHYALRMTDSIEVEKRIDRLMKSNDLADSRYKSAKIKEMIEQLRGKIPARKPSPMNTRLLVEKLYGVTVNQQLQVEKYLDEKADISPLDIDHLIDFPVVWRDCWESFTSDSKYATIDPVKELEEFRKYSQHYPGSIDLQI